MSTQIQINCDYCQQTFYRSISDYNEGIKYGHRQFCSKHCQSRASDKREQVSCQWCGIKFLKQANEIKRSPNHFCSSSCAAKYNNRSKTHGTRRAKLEVWIELQLSEMYPELEIHYNQMSIVPAELDIFIPELQVAFEFNGIFHYKPIYGEEKLLKTKENDKMKSFYCRNMGVELIILNTSKDKQFKPENSQKYLKRITKVIDKKLKELYPPAYYFMYV